MRIWINRLHRAEDALLVLLLSTMILLAGTQIVLRNMLDTGVVWIDPLLRVMVLWSSTTRRGIFPGTYRKRPALY